MLDFQKQVSKISGWLTKDEGEFLYQGAKKVAPNEKIVEIGSWKGRSTICLAQGCKDGMKTSVYSVDPHTGSSEHKEIFGKINTYQEFLENIRQARLEKYVIPIKSTSQEAARRFSGILGLLFIDGAHEYDYVKLDYELWFPRLANGRIICFHDCWQAPGVHLFTSVLLFMSSKIKNPKLIDTLTVFEKTKQNSILDRIVNMGFIIYRLLFGWVGVIKMDYFGTVLK